MIFGLVCENTRITLLVALNWEEIKRFGDSQNNNIYSFKISVSYDMTVANRHKLDGTVANAGKNTDRQQTLFR